MRFLAAIALGYFLVVGKLGGQGAQQELGAGMMEPARAELDRTLSAAFDEPREFDALLDTPKRRVAPGSRVISLTAGCRAAQAFDTFCMFAGLHRDSGRQPVDRHARFQFERAVDEM